MKDAKEKRVIKRYRNRKLYDTVDSCYVTLEDIADLIRAGEEIQVIDNTRREDLTGVTLAQIILEEERGKPERLPLNTLIQLIRSGGETLRDFVQKSIGERMKEVHLVKDEIYDHLEGLIQRGSLTKDECHRLLASILHFVESKVKPTVMGVQNIPMVQNEVKHLRKKLEDLERRLTPAIPKKKG